MLASQDLFDRLLAETGEFLLAGSANILQHQHAQPGDTHAIRQDQNKIVFRKIIERAPGWLSIDRQVFGLDGILHGGITHRFVDDGPDQGCQRDQSKRYRNQEQNSHQLTPQMAGSDVTMQGLTVRERGSRLTAIWNQVPQRDQPDQAADKAADHPDAVVENQPEQQGDKPRPGKPGYTSGQHTEFGAVTPAGGDDRSRQAAVETQQQAEKQNGEECHMVSHV